MPNIPCLVQTGYSFIDIAPMVAPLEYITDCDGISHADDFCIPNSVINSLLLVRYLQDKSSILINGIVPSE